jgi:hypothetical protein
VAEYQHNPHKVRAFLQVVKSASPDVLVMVWRILQGMGVARIEMEYQTGLHFRLHVWLSSPYEGGEPEVYESKDIDDAVILRHMGIMKMDDRPVFDGFYAVNLSKS